MDQCSTFKHNHDQRYPDLICQVSQAGLEVKATIQVGKGGESHNGHSGWHTVVCFERSDAGIQFVHVMFAMLKGHQEPTPTGSTLVARENTNTGSRRTETYHTTGVGTTKLRDGSAYLDPSRVNYSRWREQRHAATRARLFNLLHEHAQVSMVLPLPHQGTPALQPRQARAQHLELLPRAPLQHFLEWPARRHTI
jgi:hypothetical protein